VLITGVSTMVSLHLALALPNVLILEHVRDDVPWRREVVDEAFTTQEGWAAPPTKPGIGVELVEEVAAAHVGRSPRPHPEFGLDGSLLDW
jgi:galactonate dehydratase